MSVTTFPYKGISVFFIDYTSCNNKVQEHLKVMKEAEEKIKKIPLSSKLYMLSDVSGQSGSKEFMDLAKRLNNELLSKRPNVQTVVGITGLKKILLNGYNRVSSNKTVPFSSKEKALEYLLECHLTE